MKSAADKLYEAMIEIVTDPDGRKRARVARYVEDTTGQVAWTVATNWEDLEAEAMAAVADKAHGGMRHFFPCPPELAARAKYGKRTLMNVSEFYGDHVPATPEDIIELCHENGWPVPDFRIIFDEDEIGRQVRVYADRNTGRIVLRDEWSDD